MTSIEDLVTRLDKQAKAIRDLRARVKELEDARPRAATVQHVAPGEVHPVGSKGSYVPNRNCLNCGRDKYGRKTLTCADCGLARQHSILNKTERPQYPTCGNCGEKKGGGMQILCTPCSRSFKEWKTAQD